MKSIAFNIRFLTWVLIIWSLIIIVSRIWSAIIFYDSELEFRLLGETLPSTTSPFYYKGIVGLYCLSLMYLIYYMNIFRKVLTEFFNDLLFSPENGIQLKRVANGVLYFAIFLLVFKLFLVIYSLSLLEGAELEAAKGYFHNDIAYSKGYNYGRALAKSVITFVPILVISQLILLLSEMIEKGYLIKTENDLTI